MAQNTIVSNYSLDQVVQKLGLTDAGAAAIDSRPVTGAYASDLLSDVMGFATHGEVWLSVQSHLNIVAVAGLKELACVIVCNGRTIDEPVLQKAREEGVVLLLSEASVYEVAGQLWELGIRRGTA